MLKRLSSAQWFCLGAAIVIALLGLTAYYADSTFTQSTVQLIGAHKTGIGMLTEDALAAQTFRAEQNGLQAVDVMVSTYNKKVKEGTLTLWLTDESGREAARRTYPVSELKNNAFVTLPLSEADDNSAGRLYTLHAVSDCVEQKGVSLRMGPLTAPNADTVLILADGTEERANALNMRCQFRRPARGSMAMATLLLVAMCFAACVPLAGRKESTHE